MRHCSWSFNKATSSAPDFNHAPVLGTKELHHSRLRPTWNSRNAVNRHAKSKLVAFNQQIFDEDVEIRVLRKKARQRFSQASNSSCCMSDKVGSEPLGTTFVPPHLPVALIQRDRLLAELQTASGHRLVLLSASAGSGKTPLLATWAVQMRASAQALAWFSLSKMENDPTRFWTSPILTLRTCSPSFGEAALHLLQSLQPAPLLTVLTALINEVLE